MSGLGVSQLLGVPKLYGGGPGEAQATAVAQLLQEWGVVDRVSAMCFDTTASSTGHRNGACVLLEQKLEKDLLHLACRQWRSNGRFSRFKEPGSPTVRGPRPTVSLVRQAVNTCHSCKTKVQRDRYINNKEKLSLGSLAFSNLKELLNFIIQIDFVSSFLDFVKTLSLFLTLQVSVASDERNFSKLKLIMTY